MAQLLLFTKRSNDPFAKTRLRADFPHHQIQTLHHAFVLDSLRLCELSKLDTFVAWSKLDEEPLEQNLEVSKYPDFVHLEQSGETFGIRLQNAIDYCTRLRPNKDLIIIGSDCPYLTPKTINSAMNAIKPDTIVLGPSTKGGFYLLGIPAQAKEIDIHTCFETENEIENVIKTYGLKAKLLEQLKDIDQKEDLLELIQNHSNSILEFKYTTQVLSEHFSKLN